MKTLSFDQLAAFIIEVIGILYLAAALLDADLVLWAVYIGISIPANVNTFFIQRAIVFLLTLLWGFTRLINRYWSDLRLLVLLMYSFKVATAHMLFTVYFGKTRTGCSLPGRDCLT